MIDPQKLSDEDLAEILDLVMFSQTRVNLGTPFTLAGALEVVRKYYAQNRAISEPSRNG